VCHVGGSSGEGGTEADSWVHDGGVRGDWRQLLNGKRHNFHSLSYIIGLIKLNSMNLAGHVTHMAKERNAYGVLILSSSVMPCDIILLILSFICYNFFGLVRVNSFHLKKCYNFGGWKGLTFSIPKNATIFWGWKGLTPSSPKNRRI
jgi:hypothetical protein